MRVMVLVKANADTEAGMPPDPELLVAMGQFNEALVKAGVLLSGDGLKPSSAGARVKFSGKNRSVVDGPFTETKELVAGYWMWQVRSLEEAVEWVKRCPNPTGDESVNEIRPVYEIGEFEPAMTPEAREIHDRVRQKLEGDA